MSNREKTNIIKGIMRVMLAILIGAWSIVVHAQEEKFVSAFKLKDNKMFLILSKQIPISALNMFTSKYNIKDIGLYQLIKTGKDDSLRTNGWNMEIDKDLYIVSKPFAVNDGLNKAEGRIIYSAIPTPDTWRVVGGNKVVYGYNRFNSFESVTYKDGIAHFIFAGHPNVKTVRLAGSFTNWQFGSFPMTKTEKGWEVDVKLPPGPHYYKFLVNNGWTTDPANERAENDGRGNVNSLVYLPNKIFLLKGFPDAKKVYLAGSFNNWAKNDISLSKTAEGWEVDLYLDQGTYQYEYIADGVLIKQSGNDNSNTNPVAAIGSAHHFVLNGFSNAKKVAVTGNFNDWDPKQLFMQKTEEGWVLDYVLGPGNYQYKFIVDGQFINDPKNKSVISDGKGSENSFLIIGPNYTFILRGYTGAKKVYLAGEFSNWSELGIPMTKTEHGWICKVFLGRGKHLYKFIVDGEWIIDPRNRQYEEDEKGNANSVMWME